MKEVEYEQIILKLPKALIEFLKAIGCDPSKYFVQVILETFRADFDELKTSAFFNVQELKQKFNLKPILEG